MSKNNKPTKSELAKSKLTKLEVAELIRRGAVSSLRKAMAAGQFEVPGDLIDMNYNKDTALHIAARYGQVGVLKFLVADLVDKDGKPYGLSPLIRNNQRKPIEKLRASSDKQTQDMPMPLAGAFRLGSGVLKMGAAAVEVAASPFLAAKDAVRSIRNKAKIEREHRVTSLFMDGASDIKAGLANFGMTALDVGRYVYGLEREFTAALKKQLFNTDVPDDQKATAVDIAKAYGKDIFEKGERNEVMLAILRVAEMDAGEFRDKAIERIRNMNVEKFSNEPSFGETIFRQTLRPKQSTELESNAAYYNQIRVAFEDKWQKEMEGREEKLAKQRQFFSKVNQGLVGGTELKEYLNEFSIDATTAPSIGSKNILDIAVESGNFEEVKLFVSGIVRGEGDDKEILRLDIGDRARGLLEDALRYDPESEGHLKIQEFFLQVEKSGPPEPSPSQPLEAERLKGQEFVMEMDG